MRLQQESFTKRAADTVYVIRFIRLLLLPWDQWDAFKLGLIDKNGKRIKKNKLDSLEKKSAFTPFVRLVANIKRLIGRSKLMGIAGAAWLLKEDKDDNATLEQFLEAFEDALDKTEPEKEIQPEKKIAVSFQDFIGSNK